MSESSTVARTEQPVFVGGMFKSGTSLLRAMLGQHSRLASGLETYWFELPWDGPREALYERIDRLATFFDFAVADVRAMAEASPDAPGFLDRLLGAYAARSGKPRWVEKTPGNVAHLQRIFATWPGAKAIHILRDPKDIYASLRQARKWDDPEAFAERWCAIVGGCAREKEGPGFRPERFLEIRYERLATDPEPVMREVVAFLDEPWEPAAGQFGGRAEDFDKVLAATGKASTTLDRLRQPLSSDRVALWRQVLQPADVEAMRAAIVARGFGELLARVEAETQGAEA